MPENLGKLEWTWEGEIVHLLSLCSKLLVPCKTPPAWTTTEIVLR